MVTWGQNTVHTFGSSNAAPAPGGGSLFGSSNPAPAPSTGGFGFGSPSPAPSTGGFGGFGASSSPGPAPSTGFGGFGSSPAPSSGPSLFAAPAPGGSLFATPAPAPGGSLFGSSSTGTSLFGAPSSAPGGSLFGAFGSQPQQQQQQQPQIPAQAALHAHMEAKNRQETERIKAALSKLHAVYAGTGAPPPTDGSSEQTKFLTIVYNDLTQEQRQLQWLHGMGAGGTIMPIAPPRPQQVSEEEWNKAVVHNPDPLSYMPFPLTGADSLNARVSWQQERATQLAKDAASIQNSHETIQELYVKSHNHLEDIKRKHANQRKRLLNVMRKVEIVRCMNHPLQPDEVSVMERLRHLNAETAQVRKHLAQLEGSSRAARPQHGAIVSVDLPDRQQLHKVLTGHQDKLTKMSLQMQKDIRDVKLMTDRVVPPGASSAAGR